MACQRFADETNCTSVNHIGRAAMRLSANRVSKPASFTELPHKYATGLIDCFNRMRFWIAVTQIASGPFPDFERQSFVPQLQKRPVEMLGVQDYQSPLNMGFCLATKASYARVKSLVAMQIACACASASMASSKPMLH